MVRIKPGYFTAAGLLIFVLGTMLESSVDDAFLGLIFGMAIALLFAGLMETAQAARGGAPDIGAGQY